MKNGVYINKFNDTANLVIVKNNELEDGEAVTIFQYNLKVELSKKDKSEIMFKFKELEYLGKL